MQPAFALPHARLAVLLRGKLPDADLAAMEQRLADPKLEDGPRARLLFGLAHVLDARGQWQRAAECLRQANSLTLKLAAVRSASILRPGTRVLSTRCWSGLTHGGRRPGHAAAGVCLWLAPLGYDTG